MAIKISFMGERCYDLIHYISRIIYHMGNKVLLIDQSARDDRSLECSIPIPVGIEEGHTVDYSGVSYSPKYFEKYEGEYDYILMYYGSTYVATKLQSHWQYVICNSESNSIRNAKINCSRGSLYTLPLKEQSEGVEERFDNTIPVLLYLDLITNQKMLIEHELAVPTSNIKSCELSLGDYELRLKCQYDSAIKFTKISQDYKAIVKECCLSILGKDEDKTFLQAYKEAERGR